MTDSTNSDGADDPTASSPEPPWPDPSKASWGYQPVDPYQQPGYGANRPPMSGGVPGRRSTVWWLVGGAVLLAVLACAAGVLIARLLD